MPLNSEDIEAVCLLVSDLCGICLDESKAYLIESRLGQLLETHECRDYRELVRKVRLCRDGTLPTKVVGRVPSRHSRTLRTSSR